MSKTFDVPLTAFRVFVSVGRHGNFTRAAASLGITQSGVSRQIAKLEALANTPHRPKRRNPLLCHKLPLRWAWLPCPGIAVLFFGG